MDAKLFAECVELLERTPRALDGLLRGLPEAWVSVDEGEGTWDARGVLEHLIHCEKVDWMVRVKTILEHGTEQVFAPLDREAWKGKPLREVEVLLDEFAAVRAANLRELGGLELDFEKQGMHPVFGTVELGQLLATWAAHDMTHLVQVGRVLGKRMKDEVGPWAAFLGVLR